MDTLATQVQAVKDRRAAAPAGKPLHPVDKAQPAAVQPVAVQPVADQTPAVEPIPAPVQAPRVGSMEMPGDEGSDMTATLTDKRGTSTIGGKRTHMDTGNLADEDAYGSLQEAFDRWKKIINHNK